MSNQITVLWQGRYEEAEVVGIFGDREIIARLGSGQEIVIPAPKPDVNPDKQLASIAIASRIFDLDFLAVSKKQDELLN